MRVELVDNTVEAHGLEISIPLTIFDASFTAVLSDASVHIAWNEDGSFTGYMAGGLDPQAIIDMANDSNVDRALAESLPALFEPSLDLRDESGTCSLLSITFQFEGVSGYFYPSQAAED